MQFSLFLKHSHSRSKWTHHLLEQHRRFADNEFTQRWRNYYNHFAVRGYLDVICLLLLGSPALLYKLSTFYFSSKGIGIFFKLNIHAFLMKHNSLLKNAKGNSFILFRKHTDWWQRETHIQKNSPDKLSKIGKSLQRTKLQNLPSNQYLVTNISWCLGLLLNLVNIFSQPCWPWTFILPSS